MRTGDPTNPFNSFTNQEIDLVWYKTASPQFRQASHRIHPSSSVICWLCFTLRRTKTESMPVCFGVYANMACTHYTKVTLWLLDRLDHRSVIVDPNTVDLRHPQWREHHSILKGPQGIAKNSGYSMREEDGSDEELLGLTTHLASPSSCLHLLSSLSVHGCVCSVQMLMHDPNSAFKGVWQERRLFGSFSFIKSEHSKRNGKRRGRLWKRFEKLGSEPDTFLSEVSSSMTAWLCSGQTWKTASTWLKGPILPRITAGLRAVCGAFHVHLDVARIHNNTALVDGYV